MSLYQKTRSILREAGIHLNKQLGQNFLVDQNILDFIVQSTEPSKDDLILELGSGIGILTEELARYSGKLIGIELDRNLFNILQNNLQYSDNAILINSDMLKLDFTELFGCYMLTHNIKIIGNLPYYITSPALIKIVEAYKSIDFALVMMQEEVGIRITASPGNKEYGALSIAIAYRCVPKIIKRIPSDCFYPKPKVDSVLVKLNMLDVPSVHVKDEKLFFQVVRGSFQHRRKTLRNALIMSCHSGMIKAPPHSIDEALMNFDPKIRGEMLSIEQFAELADKIYDNILY